jgi:hydrogenase maturation protease
VLGSSDSRVLVIGVGNELRGDDAVGLQVARSMRERFPTQCKVVEEAGDGARLMELWKTSHVTILVDAVASGDKAGKIHRHEAHNSPLPASMFQYSTHAFGVSHAIELARAMNQLPPRFIVYGVEGTCFNEGSGMSTLVEQAALKVVESIALDVTKYQPLTSTTPQ